MNGCCNDLHLLFSKMPEYRFPFEPQSIPSNGIYVLFEEGEFAHGANRIVRVGTHTGNNQLRSRLQQHFVAEKKDRSIFRKHIGRALLNRDQDPFIRQWQIDLTTRAAKDQYAHTINFDKLHEVEQQVTAYVRSAFRFAVFRVDDKDKRLELESKIISTVSLCEGCASSNDWLGKHSPVGKIQKSGLWLVNELYKTQLEQDELEGLERLIANS